MIPKITLGKMMKKIPTKISKFSETLVHTVCLFLVLQEFQLPYFCFFIKIMYFLKSLQFHPIFFGPIENHTQYLIRLRVVDARIPHKWNDFAQRLPGKKMKRRILQN